MIAADPERDLVVVPTSSPSPDYFGGERRGANVYANSVVALRGSTGARLWQFQVVHHDLWDYDVPAPPALVSVTREGSPLPAVPRGFPAVYCRVAIHRHKPLQYRNGWQ